MYHELTLGVINKDLLDTIREGWNNGGVYLGNDYMIITYKDGSMYIEDAGGYYKTNGEPKPSLNTQSILYIEYFFTGDGYKNSQVYVNPRLDFDTMAEVVKQFFITENGDSIVYDEIDDKRLPYTVDELLDDGLCPWGWC